MRVLFLFLGFISFSIHGEWLHDIGEAEVAAKVQHHHILLNFSGSDWCGPCIKMRTELFLSPAFIAMADTSLVLVNADFPRSKKNQLPQSQQLKNNAMADRYNPAGKFPFTILLNENGKVLKEWEGFTPDIGRRLVMEIQNGIYDDRN